ncbi:MAG: ATP-binding cassette domain-containing protein [Candidatus Aminicenantes bacterium]|nr:ATP-binding cassette domain-containing protein [Candidatus Aminicenantes bacterium]
MNQAIVETRELSFGFSRKKVLDELCVSFPESEWAVIAGRNGVGKSTLLRLLAGVLFPKSGTIVRAEAARQEKIGFISDTLSLFEDWTVERAIAFHCRAFAVDRFDDRLFTRLGLGQTVRIKNLSAGERAILHLSLVLSQQPSLLLIDEVMHMLDPYIRDLFIEALIEHMAAKRATVLTVNHTFSEIEKIPERLLVMDGGRFVVDEPTEALGGLMKKVISREPLPEALPCFFKKTDGIYKEYYIYPFREELRAEHGLEFQDIALAEIVKAFIGGGYEQKRMA